jgi:hypothetical protein
MGFDKIFRHELIIQLKTTYQAQKAIPETGDEIYKVYVETVNKPYESFKIKEYLHKDIVKLKVSNYGNIEYDGNILKPSLVKNRVQNNCSWKKYMNQWENYLEIIIPGIENVYPLLLVHRLVAEVWCENNIGIDAIVHHIGNDLENNSKNLIFVTKEEHKFIHEK